MRPASRPVPDLTFSCTKNPVVARGLLIRPECFEKKNILDGQVEITGDAPGQLQGRIVFPLLKENDGLPPHADPFGEFYLGQPIACPKFLNASFHEDCV